MAINYRPILNGEDRREILHLGLANYALNNGNDEAAATFADKNIEDFAARPWSGYTDWKDVLFRNGSHQNYDKRTRRKRKNTFLLPLLILNRKVLQTFPAMNLYRTCQCNSSSQSFDTGGKHNVYQLHSKRKQRRDQFCQPHHVLCNDCLSFYISV